MISFSLATSPALRRTPRDHDFAKFFIGQSQYVRVSYFGVRVKKILYCTRIGLFSAAYDHVFRAAGDVQVTVRAHDSEIASVKPAVSIDRTSRCFRVSANGVRPRCKRNAIREGVSGRSERLIDGFAAKRNLWTFAITEHRVLPGKVKKQREYSPRARHRQTKHRQDLLGWRKPCRPARRPGLSFSWRAPKVR